MTKLKLQSSTCMLLKFVNYPTDTGNCHYDNNSNTNTSALRAVQKDYTIAFKRKCSNVIVY